MSEVAEKGVLDFVLASSRAQYFNYLVRDAAMGIVKLHHTLMFCDKCVRRLIPTPPTPPHLSH